MNVAAEQQFPAKWPFPPAPPARRSWGLPGWNRPGRGRATLRPDLSHGQGATGLFSGASFGGAVGGPVSGPASNPVSAAASAPSAAVASQGVSPRQMVVDILLVAMWGAMIPALMWLGAAAGF
jgi:hypothetical protein